MEEMTGPDFAKMYFNTTPPEKVIIPGTAKDAPDGPPPPARPRPVDNKEPVGAIVPMEDKGGERVGPVTVPVATAERAGAQAWLERVEKAEQAGKTAYAGTKDLNPEELRVLLRQKDADQQAEAALKEEWSKDVGELKSTYGKLTGGDFDEYLRLKLGQVSPVTKEGREIKERADEFERATGSDTDENRRLKEIFAGVMEDARGAPGKDDKKPVEKTQTTGAGVVLETKPIGQMTEGEKRKSANKEMATTARRLVGEAEARSGKPDYKKIAGEITEIAKKYGVTIALGADEIMEAVEHFRKKGGLEGEPDILTEAEKLREEKAKAREEAQKQAPKEEKADKKENEITKMSMADLQAAIVNEGDTNRLSLLRAEKEARIKEMREIFNKSGRKFDDEIRDTVDRTLQLSLPVYFRVPLENIHRPEWHKVVLPDDEKLNSPRLEDLFNTVLNDEAMQVLGRLYLDPEVISWGHGANASAIGDINKFVDRSRIGLTYGAVMNPVGILKRVPTREEWFKSYNRFNFGFSSEAINAINAAYDEMDRKRAVEEAARKTPEPQPTPPGSRGGRGGVDEEEEESRSILRLTPAQMRERLTFRLKFQISANENTFRAWLDARNNENTPELRELKALDSLNRVMVDKKAASYDPKVPDLKGALFIEENFDRSLFIELFNMEGTQHARWAILDWFGLDMEQMKRDGVTVTDFWKGHKDIRDYMPRHVVDGKEEYGSTLFQRRIIDKTGREKLVDVNLSNLGEVDKEEFWNRLKGLVEENIRRGRMPGKVENADEIATVAFLSLRLLGVFETMVGRVPQNMPFLDMMEYAAERFGRATIFNTLNFDFLDASAHHDLLKSLVENELDPREQDRILNRVLVRTRGERGQTEELTVRDLLIAPEGYKPPAFNPGLYSGGILQSVIDLPENVRRGAKLFDTEKLTDTALFEDHNKMVGFATARDSMQKAPIAGGILFSRDLIAGAGEETKSGSMPWVKWVNEMVLLRAKNLTFVSRSKTLEQLKEEVEKPGNEYMQPILNKLTAFYASRALGFRLMQQGGRITIALEGGNNKVKRYANQATTFLWAQQAEGLNFNRTIKAFLEDPDNSMPLQTEWGRHLFSLLKDNDGDVIGILKAYAMGTETPYEWEENKNGLRRDNKAFRRWPENRDGWIDAKEALRRFVEERAQTRDIRGKMGGLGLGDSEVESWLLEKYAVTKGRVSGGHKYLSRWEHSHDFRNLYI